MSEIRLRDDKLQWLETEGEVVALDSTSLAYLGLNESGAVLWQALAAGTTRDALVALLVETFTVDPGVAAVDIDAFLTDLEQRELIVR